MINRDDILRYLGKYDLNGEERVYLDYHAQRLAYAVNQIQLCCREHRVGRILDVGPHFLTLCLKRFLEPEVSISTMGWQYEKIVANDTYEEHCQFDLNDCGEKEILFRNGRFDLIVLSETIEHLYTSPEIILSELRHLLYPTRGILFLQTPNAVTLKNRLRMLAGKNPYELIRKDRTNPGHYREYTMNELARYGREAGFSVIRSEYCRYWKSRFRLLAIVESLVPSFRQGFTIIFKS